MRISSILVGITLCICIQSSNAQPLIVNYGQHNSPPYAFIESGNLVDGIIKDIMDQVGTELELNIKYVETPRKRISSYLAKGQIHVLVLSNPRWIKDSDLFLWSEPLMKEKNWILTNARSSFDVKSYNDLAGRTIGTILGYYYPGLMDYFSKGIVIREDTLTLKQSIDKLRAGRIDALINSDILIQYHLKSNNITSSFNVAEKVASEHMLSSAFYSKSPIEISKIDKVYRVMKDRGDIERILDKYR